MQRISATLGRWSLLAIGVTLVAALCVAAILLAGSRPEEVSKTSSPKDARHSTRSDHAPSQEPTMIDGHHVLTAHEALVQDARSYAKDMDVPLSEAIRRLKMQDDPFLSRLDRELKETAPDTYVELRLRHRPDYGLPWPLPAILKPQWTR